MKAQDNDTTFYLLTCGPGTELYSIYGHTALMVVTGKKDAVYNWGVFDFDTPNFGWRFAKGRLDYMVDSGRLQDFLRTYFHEQRFVLSQKINLLPGEKRWLMELITENLEPENKYYRYDFFYDDCSTRIRDLLEKVTNKGLVYPDEVESDIPTFRDMIGKYQKPYPWLQFGIDLLVGSEAEKKANVRDRMFLPVDMMDGLTETYVDRNGDRQKLLEPAIPLLDFIPPEIKPSFFTSPLLVFSLILLLTAFLTIRFYNSSVNNLIDYFFFFIFASIAVLMIFFNFFSDHDQLRRNYNIIWLNPFIIAAFISVLANRGTRTWFRIVFVMTCLFLLMHLFLPQAFNPANYPLILIIMLRSYVRSEFAGDPFRARQPAA